MCCMLTACNDESAINYNKATKLLESGDYEEAYSIFEELGDYKDAKTYLSRFQIKQRPVKEKQKLSPIHTMTKIFL